MNERPFPHLSATDIDDLAEDEHIHQFNANAIRHTKSLGDLLGLKTMGVHLVRVEPGKRTTEYHRHHQDEEFVYVLAGSGIAEIGETTVTVSPGDFMAFARHSLPHAMENNHPSQDLVYLMGGTRSEIDICDYPRLNRRMVREHGKKQYFDLDELKDVT